ncbi:MAG: ribosome biogenesis/translation initiation ATPase RLI [Candidatus Thermoplasmatota archaeon]|nr:ribosome biogenesis/translation initiation ATPase RLI [Candidatus Thermoplasmatota archaeon]MCL5730637.1 ribosome biogenesis/translation initiation ATPase RLI [Candidatus Thermoplasmatota archaeon]
MHVAILDREKCHPKKCNHECQYYCPPVRSGTPTIEFLDYQDEPVINEPLCIGCGICVKRCPFGAIKIVSLPEESGEMLHRYGVNSFRLYSLPTLERSKVTAVLGKNGLGKTTALNILSGITIPNLGNYEQKGDMDKVIENFSGSVLGDYFRSLYSGKMKVVLKNQYVDKIPMVVSGTVRNILQDADETSKMDYIVERMGLENILSRDIKECSGGELQKTAVAVALLKESDTLLIDEMSSYLDIGDRVSISLLLQELGKTKNMMIVEHDLAILDWLADTVFPVYGEPGAYGIVASPRTTSRAINSFLEGYLREENVRIREYQIQFSTRNWKRSVAGDIFLEWKDVTKKLGSFRLTSARGAIRTGEVIGCLGRNGTGKTTFARLMAGVLEPDTGEFSRKVRIAYKPQYIYPSFEGTSEEMLRSVLKSRYEETFNKAEIFRPLDIEELMGSIVKDLSGGELQRLSIALTLAMDADLYLLDEPSAHLDSSYRMTAAKVIKRVMENNKKTAIVIDHDLYFIDLISDELMIFSGVPGVEGISHGPMNMRDGMNEFLSSVGITFRRDGLSHRPRINKPGSTLDKQQRESGEYYYLDTK